MFLIISFESFTNEPFRNPYDGIISKMPFYCILYARATYFDITMGYASIPKILAPAQDS